MTADLVATRRSLHAVAEHVLAAASRAATGRIGLDVAPGGFATRDLGGGRRIAVEGTDLVVHGPPDERRAPITTVRAAAALVGAEPAAPADLYPPATDPDLDEPLPLDPAAASALAGWLALGDAALRRFVAAHPDEAAGEITLWPEHLDVATSAARVNYGASPGDDHHPEPYLYVGPWEPRPGPWWNAPFGRLVPATEVADVAAALAVLEEGRARALTR